MPNDMDKTTGKDYRKEPARRCNACHRVFAVTSEQLKRNSKARCVYCGCTVTEPFQRTTANLPDSGE